MKISVLYRKGMKIISSTSFNPQVGLVLTLEECLLGTLKGAHSYHLFPLGEDGSGLDLIFSLLKKSLEEVDHTIGLHFKLISDDFWLIQAWMFLASTY